MEMVLLDSENQMGKMVQPVYDSLIWTERYIMGDFKIETGDIDYFLDILPEGQVVSLRESKVAMKVETHLIERKAGAPAKLTISGRECTAYLDQRISAKAIMAALDEWLVVAKLPSDIAFYIIYKVCVEGVCDPNDIFPSSQLLFLAPDDYLSSPGPNREFSVPRGNLLETVSNFLRAEGPADPTTTPASPLLEPRGIRALRPDTGEGTAIGIEIYKGVDRSDSVYFDGTRELLDEGKYLFSKVGSATDAYVLTPDAAAKVGTGAGGLERRVILVENSNSGLPDDALKQEGSMAISQAAETAIFDGSINSDLNPYVYGVHYGLGDIVRLVGDYGLDEKARLTEFIRSDGPDGYKQFPTFTTIPSYY